MSEELNALKRLTVNKYANFLRRNEDITIIEQALKEKDEIARALSIATCENGDLLNYKKALEIIKQYGYFDEQGDLIVHLPTNRKEERDLLKEVVYEIN